MTAALFISREEPAENKKMKIKNHPLSGGLDSTETVKEAHTESEIL